MQKVHNCLLLSFSLVIKVYKNWGFEFKYEIKVARSNNGNISVYNSKVGCVFSVK